MEQNFRAIEKEEFKNLLNSKDHILIDVRTPEELVIYWKIRENQNLITFWDPDFVDKINKLDKDKKYLLYCWHGNRSKAIMDYMKAIWFKYVKELKWGIDDWNRK